MEVVGFMDVRVVVQTEDAAPAGVERLGCLHHGQRQVHAVEHGTARAGIGGEFGVRQEVQGRVELLDRTRAGLLLGVERILDTADEEARLVDPSAQDALRRRAQLVADGLQHVLYRRQDVLLAVAEARQVVALDLVEVGEDDVQLAGVAGDRDALEGGDRGRLHRLGGVVDQQHRGDATSVAPRDAAPEHTWRPDDGPVSRGKD
jgi:hypothetical protein